jgi:hypothetical protein
MERDAKMYFVRRCGEKIARVAELEAEVERLNVIKARTHEWVANYPLGGGMDTQVASEIYQICQEADDE